jgi:oxygen-independent coproporphyrinogen-3 oxidase
MDIAPQMGFEQYEISNFASKGQYAIHNTNYWKGVPYLGIGPSAHSFNQHNRCSNIANNSIYIKSILQEKTLNHTIEHLNQTERINEYLMISLRTMWGCDLTKIDNEWGAEWSKQVLKESRSFLDKDWLTIQDNILLLTNKGKLFADHIASTLFVSEG